MQCHSCGAEVRSGQKFCMECGSSLRDSGDPAADVAPGAAGSSSPPPPRRPLPGPPFDQATAPLPTIATTRPRPDRDATVRMPATAPWPTGRTEAMTPPADLHVVPSTATPVRLDDTGEVPRDYPPTRHAEPRPRRPVPRGFRMRPMLILALLAAGATAVGASTTMIAIATSSADVPFEIGTWRVNDFGTNNAVAGFIAAGAMVLGGLAWCFGFRWGAGLAGGAGAALAGWVALLVGLAEFPIATAESAASVVPSTITRDIGYWTLVGAGAVGILMLLISLARAGRDGRAGLDPWIAALGAVSFLIAAGGPLIPQANADWSGNYSSETLAVELPTLFFVGRAVQLGVLALCGVVGFLLVRRYGLGLAVGAATACGWMLATAATDQTASPIGPGFANPGALDAVGLRPHAVTIVGMALVGFFALVAIVMAILDTDR